MASADRGHHPTEMALGAMPLRCIENGDIIARGRAIRTGESAAAGVQAAAACPDVLREPRVVDPETPKPPLPSKIGRRAAARLRLSLPGQLIAVERVHRCILMNLSRTGAQVAILDALREGEGAILRCGSIDHFTFVTRSEFGLNALQFEEPLTDREVLEIRHLYENFEERERRALMETARKWVTGDNGA
jgi:hypothetical protein